MIDTLTFTPALIMDLVLIMISGLACLYCAMLSRRLQRLNNLKSGLGASIVTLTKAIETTHKAAMEAQLSTQSTVETLTQLLSEAERKTSGVDALIGELKQASEYARSERDHIMDDVEHSLSPAIEKAQTTASELLEVVNKIQRYKKALPAKKKNVVPLKTKEAS